MMYRGGPRDPRLDTFGGQCGQDLTIAEIFKHGQGTFLDLAANDAVHLSNSLALEQKYGWKGICIEPNPVYTQGYLHRNCQLVQAVVGPKEDIKVEFNFDGYMGGIDGFDNKNSNKTATHYTVSIAKILRDFGMPRNIDFLSLDIEGAEAWAFESFPWQNYTFSTMTVERPKPALRSLLELNSYTFLCYHGPFGDELWVHKSFADYAQVLLKYQGRDQCRDLKVGENWCSK